MKLSKVVIVLLTISGIILLSTGIYLSINSPSIQSISTEEEKEEQKKEEVQEVKEVYVNPLPEYRTLHNNNDIMAKLEIPSLSIDALITISTDNAYYLSYNIDHYEDGLGVPFFDYRNTNLKEDKQINIYGHNTLNEKYYDALPFKKLESYKEEEFFTNNKDIYLYTDQEKVKYHVVAVKFVTDEDNEHMRITFKSNEEYLNHLNKLLNNTLYKDEIDVKSINQLLVLQACNFTPVRNYLLVIAKRIEDQ